ncbi:HAD family hydrolase [Massilia scottii]|uniref:HAD family hydrolase n=1 Tax=Massilia scottii TaxID=3057166 RepID=UPI00279648F8|nr:HAD family phosphatase [Massilia sp. CCM 9029]MDQ1832058.1 HAD family phosphatase [Massilia sp. CCM 9029]
MIKGILWDNDGVLVDTEHLFYAVNRELFLEHQIALSEEDFFAWFLADNIGAWHLMAARGATADQIGERRDERNRRYGARLRSETGLAMQHIDSVLSRGASRVPMGVVTSARRADFDIIHAGLDLMRHFRFALTAEDYRHSKPSPEPYLAGLDKLGVAAADCLAVEDSPRGLQAARAAGIECIVLRHRLMRNYRFDGAYRVVDTVAQLDAEIAALLPS